MTSNPFNYGAAQVKGEGEPVWEQGPRSPEEEIEMLNEQIKHLRRYRIIYGRIARIASQGNLMINHPDKGFVLVEDLQEYMMEPL
jgi:hypothetical protein